MVLIAGEAGIGKTRLALAVAELAGATGGMVVQARCYEAERSLFLQPLAEAVRAAAMALPPARVGAAAGDAAATLAELVPDLRRLLALEGYERAPAELERRRSFEAVTAFLRDLAAQQPLLVVDPPAAEALLELARTHGSAKYQALALAHLGHRDEATRIATPVGSDYLPAQVAPPARARAAIGRIAVAAALPPDLRPAFLERGQLVIALAH